MENSEKYLSEMAKYEIININDGDKYNYLGNNDIAIDEDGNLKLLLLNEVKNSFSFFNKGNFFEVPWECVKKIGSRTIIIDMEQDYSK